MKRKNALVAIWIIIAPLICTIVAKVAASYFVWVMLFAVAYSISIILLTKGGNMELSFNDLKKLYKVIIIKLEKSLLENSKLESQVTELRRELERKNVEIAQCEDEKNRHNYEIEKLGGRIEDLENRCREMEYRWQLWQDWAKLLQKRYYDESSQRQDDIRRQLDDCGFSLEHYSAENEEWFTIELLNRLSDEPEYKETKPALIFINDGNKELISKGTLLKFVEEK